MSAYIDFPVDEIINGVVQLVRGHRNKFNPNLVTVDLDEFFGVGKDLSGLPDFFVIVRPDEGEFAYAGLKSSDDVIKLAVILYARVDMDNPRDGSLPLLRQLVRVLRSTESLDTLSTLVSKNCEIKSVRPTGYAPDNQFSNENLTGWAVNVDVAVTCKATAGTLPTYP